MAKMFSSLRLATMRSHKKQRPGSVTTNASSDSNHTVETTTSFSNSNATMQKYFYTPTNNFFTLDELIDNANTSIPTSLVSKVAQVS